MSWWNHFLLQTTTPWNSCLGIYAGMASLPVHFLFASSSWGIFSRWWKRHDIILPLCDRVIHYGDNNRMTVQNVAIVFGPTLLRPETESANITMFMVFQNQIVEFILNECERIFHWGWMCSSHLHWRVQGRSVLGTLEKRNKWVLERSLPRICEACVSLEVGAVVSGSICRLEAEPPTF